jgi:hypothetical protein
MEPTLGYARTPTRRRLRIRLSPQLLGLLAFAALLLSVADRLARGHLSMFYSASALVIVVGGTAALLIMTLGLRGALRALNGPPAGDPANEPDDHVLWLRLAAIYALACGFVALLLNAVGMLGNLGGNLEMMGHHLAMALVGQLYGALLAALCYGGSLLMERRRATRTACVRTDPSLRLALILGFLAVVGGSLATIGMMWLVILSLDLHGYG